MRKIGDYESQGFRPYTKGERSLLSVQEALFVRRAKVRMLTLFAVPGLLFAALVLAGTNPPAPLAIGTITVAIVWLSFTWRNDARALRAIRRDLEDGRAEDFVSKDGSSGTRAAATGRVLAENSVLVVSDVFVPVATIGGQAAETSGPGRFEDTEIGTRRVRPLSPSEIVEIKSRFRLSFGQFAFPALFTAYSVYGLFQTHRNEDGLEWLWYAPLALMGSWVLLRIGVGQFRAKRVLNDVATGYAAVVDDHGKRIEVLPKSRMVWTIDGKEAPWRTFPNRRPSRIPPKE